MTAPSTTSPSPPSDSPIGPRGRELAGVVHRNIHAIVAVRQQFEANKSLQDRMADAITHFVGSIPFVFLHAVWFGGWLVLNSGRVPGVTPFDPFPFVMLAMIASVEAIFLSTFVLISQNRMAVLADKRADLDLQVNLLAEHEITRLITIVDAIAERVGAKAVPEEAIAELKRDVDPKLVLQTIESIERVEDVSKGHAADSSAAERDPNAPEREVS
jgi:uncharacterized membrane protein